MSVEIKNEFSFAPYDRVLKFILPIIPARLKPNHLTFLRLIASPFLIIFLLDRDYIVSLILFIVLAFTDMLDGSLARLRNQVTDWGKIWDPIADKLLIGIVVATLLLKINLSLTILLLVFEAAFVLGGAFQKLKAKDVQIQADTWGKIKMNLHCLGAGFLILGDSLDFQLMIVLAQIFFYGSLFFAAISLFAAGKKGI